MDAEWTACCASVCQRNCGQHSQLASGAHARTHARTAAVHSSLLRAILTPDVHVQGRRPDATMSLGDRNTTAASLGRLLRTPVDSQPTKWSAAQQSPCAAAETNAVSPMSRCRRRRPRNPGIAEPPQANERMRASLWVSRVPPHVAQPLTTRRRAALGTATVVRRWRWDMQARHAGSSGTQVGPGSYRGWVATHTRVVAAAAVTAVRRTAPPNLHLRAKCF